jgi:hypothetical protein
MTTGLLGQPQEPQVGEIFWIASLFGSVSCAADRICRIICLALDVIVIPQSSTKIPLTGNWRCVCDEFQRRTPLQLGRF